MCSFHLRIESMKLSPVQLVLAFYDFKGGPCFVPQGRRESAKNLSYSCSWFEKLAVVRQDDQTSLEHCKETNPDIISFCLNFLN